MNTLLVVLQVLLSSSCDTGFADRLYQQGDYYRAITEYKRTDYDCTTDSVRHQCWLQIARCYRRSGRFQSAISYSSALLNEPGASNAMHRRANMNLGLTYLDSQMPQLAVGYFQQLEQEEPEMFVRMALGLIDIRTKRWAQAQSHLLQAAEASPDTLVKADVVTVNQMIAEHQTRSRKSPLVATALSTIVPGAGQIYSRHVYDGMQAFGFTISFAFATWAIYKYEDSQHDRLSWTYVGLSITSLFHVANILGANRTAKYRNWKMDADCYDAAYRQLIKYEPN